MSEWNAAELRAAAGSAEACELPPEVSYAALENDPAWQEERAFWHKVRAHLATSRPQAQLPGPEMAEALRLRLQSAPAPRLLAPAQPAQAKRRLWPWAGWSLAAASLVLWLSGGPEFVNAHPGAYDESGAYVQKVMHEVSDSADAQQSWLGIHSRPVTLDASLGLDRDRAVQVVQVVDGSPAHQVGIRPGDMLLDLGGCPMFSRWCIMHALKNQENGQSLPVRFLSASDGQVHSAQVKPLAVWR